MFVKLVHQRRYGDGRILDTGISVRECDEIYYDNLTGSVLDIIRGDDHTIIDMDTLGPDLGPDSTEKDAYDLTIMAYLMNSDGKTVDSFKLS